MPCYVSALALPAKNWIQLRTDHPFARCTDSTWIRLIPSFTLLGDVMCTFSPNILSVLSLWYSIFGTVQRALVCCHQLLL